MVRNLIDLLKVINLFYNLARFHYFSVTNYCNYVPSLAATVGFRLALAP